MAIECEATNFHFPVVMHATPGSVFVESILDLPLGPTREDAIFEQFVFGNVPDFMRKTRLVLPHFAPNDVRIEVLPDVLCVGTDDDFVRVPMNPKTAQKVADLFAGTLITPWMSDTIWKQADVRLTPATMPPTAGMTSTPWFRDHNAKVQAQLALRTPNTGLVAGHKKDVVLANTLALPEFKDTHVAIYGWHEPDGKPIQGLNPSPGEKLTHAITYADYSHGIRLAALSCTVDGQMYSLESLMTDAVLSPAFNGTGPLLYTRYPTT